MSRIQKIIQVLRYGDSEPQVNVDFLTHLRLENARLLSIIEQLSMTPGAPRTHGAMSFESVDPRPGILSPSRARKLIAEDMRRKAEEEKADVVKDSKGSDVYHESIAQGTPGGSLV